MFKEKISVLLSEAFHMVRFLNNDLKNVNAALCDTMGDLIENQKSVIVLQKQVLAAQEQVLDAKEKQLQEVQVAVKTSVEDTVKEQFKSYTVMSFKKKRWFVRCNP